MSSLQLASPESETILEQILRNNEIGKNHFTTQETIPNIIRMEDLIIHDTTVPAYEPTVSYQWSTEKTVHSPTPEAEWQSKFGARQRDSSKSHQSNGNRKHFVRKDDPLSGAWLNQH